MGKEEIRQENLPSGKFPKTFTCPVSIMYKRIKAVDGWMDGGQMGGGWKGGWMDKRMGRSINGWVDGTTLNYLLEE